MASQDMNRHSALDRAKKFLGEIEQRPLDYAEGLVYDLVEQFDAQKRRADDLEESYRALHRQWSDLADERDRLRVMLDAVLPEKTTFHVIPSDASSPAKESS